MIELQDDDLTFVGLGDCGGLKAAWMVGERKPRAWFNGAQTREARVLLSAQNISARREYRHRLGLDVTQEDEALAALEAAE